MTAFPRYNIIMNISKSKNADSSQPLKMTAFSRSNIMIKPIYEFLVWDNCKNNCKFCFQRKSPRIFDENGQKTVLNSTLEFLDSEKYEKGSHVLIVGGELFDDIGRFNILHPFFEKISEKMESGDIDLLYLNTNLIYEKECCDKLISILEIFERKNLFERLKFTTSYDIYGRFVRPNSLKWFFLNLRGLRSRFKELKIVVNMILSKQMCENVLRDKFSFKPFMFMEIQKVDVNFIPYIVLGEDMEPGRELVFDTIRKLHEQNPRYIEDWLRNIDLKQPRRMFYYKDGEFISCECQCSKCGHSENFKKYSKKGSCFVCDLKEVFNDCL